MAGKFGKILIVDDDEDVLQAAKLYLRQHVSLVHVERNPASLPGLLRNESYDVILLDMNFTRDASSGVEGFQWLNRILEIDPSAVVILITAYGDIEMAVKAIKAGATDFVLKPWQNEKLWATISAAMRLRYSEEQLRRMRNREKQLRADLESGFQTFIGASPPMLKIFDTIKKVAATEASVLILGENGTGKELVARELHRQSARAEEPFISVDMGAIPEALFESELFGHARGAFTDAKEERAGRFEIATGGTLFLDEIGNLPLPLQAKLLAALQNRLITRLGENTPRKIDIRLICASNMPLHELVAQKRFRQDLLYRINTVEIHLPPLRERREDIPLLAAHFLEIYAHKYKRTVHGISAGARHKLEHYHWPGNVRELQHALERALIMSENTMLQPEDFWFPAAGGPEGDLVLESYNLEEVEKLIIRKTLGKHSGNISKAARELGLTRTSLYRRLEKYGL